MVDSLHVPPREDSCAALVSLECQPDTSRAAQMSQTVASLPAVSPPRPHSRKRARRMRALAASLVFAVAAASTVVLVRAGQSEVGADRATVDALRRSPSLAS